ncbi:MAG: AAA family ATPase [Deltaproteobacteria bacterium]|nr:AAA family ATPase [Deltaproteobacteria bacterium]
MRENQGNLGKIGMPKLLHLIYRKADKAAALDIVREPVKKRFFFKDGVPVAATSNILNEVLGRLLMQEGIITQMEYERSLELVLKDKKRHGEVLISMGLLTPERLESFLQLQLKRRLLKIFSWNDGSYHYVKADSVPGNLTEFPLHPASLILEGISLGFYPDDRVKADLLGDLDKTFKAKEDGIYRPDDFRLNLQEKRFLASFDGTATLRQALESSDLLRHRALSLALSFIITGLVDGGRVEEAEIREEEPREPRAGEAAGDSKLNAELLFMKAKSLIKEKDYNGAIEELKKITELNPAEGEYWAYLGWAVFNNGPSNIKEAEGILKDAIDLNNDLDSAWYFLGHVFLSSGDVAWAKKAFRTALSKNPWMSEAASELKRIEAKEALPPAPEGHKVRIHALGFFEDPFTDEPLEKYLMLSSSQAEALEALLKGIRKKSGPMVLTGDRGAGKTTMALELLKRLSDDKMLSALILKPGDREIELIKAINSEVGASSGSSSTKEQLLSFGMRVSQNKIQGGNTLIVFDQAETLTPGCLKLIQYLSRLKTLQIILMGEPSFLDALKSPEFAELDGKASTRLTLSPFTLEETAAYIRKRLAVFVPGTSVLPSFDEGGIEDIFNRSGGLPAKINRLSAEALEAPSKEETGIEEFAAFEEMGPVDNGPAGDRAVNPGEMAEVEDRQEQAGFEEPFEVASVPETGDAPAGPAEAKAWAGSGTADKEEPLEGAGHTDALKHPPEEEKKKAELISFAPVQDKGPEKKASGLGRLILWIILMLAAGLAAGSVIGLYWYGKTADVPTRMTAPQKSETIPGVLETATTDGSIDRQTNSDGSVTGQIP